VHVGIFTYVAYVICDRLEASMQNMTRLMSHLVDELRESKQQQQQQQQQNMPTPPPALSSVVNNEASENVLNFYGLFVCMWVCVWVCVCGYVCERESVCVYVRVCV